MIAESCPRAVVASGTLGRLLRVRFLVLLCAPSTAAAQMTNMAPSAPAPPPAAAMPGKPAAPPVPPDYFQRYGKIVAPGTEPAHPLKLNMPFPDVGQVKIPSQQEIDMRQKLEGLADLSDDEIRTNLDNWPAFSKMNLADEGAMLTRIQMFKDHRAKVAQDKAHALGLTTLKPDQMARFEKEYWDKRLQMDRDLSKQFEPIFKARDAKINDELFREFSLPIQGVPPPPAIAQNAKPPTPPPLPASTNPPLPVATTPGH